jgi:hypothetical protein
MFAKSANTWKRLYLQIVCSKLGFVPETVTISKEEDVVRQIVAVFEQDKDETQREQKDIEQPKKDWKPVALPLWIVTVKTWRGYQSESAIDLFLAAKWR